MLTLVRDTMVDPDGYLHLYFSRKWDPVIYRDSSTTICNSAPGKGPHFLRSQY